MKLILFFCACLWTGAAFAGGDSVVLKTGTLADFDRSGSLVYEQSITLAQDPDRAMREDGRVTLTADPADEGNVALTFVKGEGRRNLGAFPQSVGNPLFMSFAESVIRDMAYFSGGSPFYIRNRIKEALTALERFSEEERAFGGKTIQVLTGEMRPFETDPNRNRMGGFQDLTLTVGMSEDVTGWYVFLDATAKADGKIVYRRHLERKP